MAPAVQGMLKSVLTRMPNPWRFGPKDRPIELAFPRQVERLVARYGTLNVAPLQPRDLTQIYREVVAAWRKGRLASLSRRTLRLSPHILFWRDAPYLLGNDPAFLTAYFEVLSERVCRPTMARGLLYAYLRDYPVDLNTFGLFCQLLTRFLEAVPGDSVFLAKWRQNVRQFDLLREAGPSTVARAWFGKGSPLQQMASTGFTGEIGRQGFIVHVARETARTLYHRLVDNAATMHDVRWFVELCTETGPRGTQFRFPLIAGPFAEALLLPFQDRDPAPELKDYITRVLLAVLRDPRLHPWPQVHERAKQVFIRWLIGETIEEFFRLIDRSAEPKWVYRRKFWMAYYRRGYISDVWVVLGPEARDEAQRMGQTLRLPSGSYGMLSGANRRQSALLLRIGSLTIMEWSHDGACRIWRDPRLAPPLYQRVYDREDLMNRNYDKRILHHSSQDYGWQRKLADYIRDQTGITVTSRDYMLDV